MKILEYFMYFLDKKRIIKMKDDEYLNIIYKKVFGEELNLENPETFNEKLNWLKIYDRKEIYTQMVDKFKAKQYVKDIIGEEYIIPIIGVYKKFREIDFENLPEKFVIKSTNDSGGVVICKNKTNFDIKKAKKKINKSLKNNFYYEYREWPYKNVKPRIIIEKYVEQNLINYRVYCFNGKAKYIYMYIEQEVNESKPEPKFCNIYNTKWELQNFHQNTLPDKKKYSKPEKLNDMIKLAEKLSRNTKFLRVDFYIDNGKILFSEMTFFPGAGLSKFYPQEVDKLLGDELQI